MSRCLGNFDSGFTLKQKVMVRYAQIHQIECCSPRTDTHIGPPPLTFRFVPTYLTGS